MNDVQPSQKYQAVHHWVYRHFGKATYCSNGHTDKKMYEWANISGKYLRDRSDWKQLCVSCHRLMDYTENQKEKQSLSHQSVKADIAQYDKNGELITTFPTLRKAHLRTGILKTAISNCLANRSFSAGGFVWRYYERG